MRSLKNYNSTIFYLCISLLQTQLSGMKTWLDDMEEYLRSVENAVLDSRDVTEAQLLESDGALEDMATLEPTMAVLKATAHPERQEEQSVRDFEKAKFQF